MLILVPFCPPSISSNTCSHYINRPEKEELIRKYFYEYLSVHVSSETDPEDMRVFQLRCNVGNNNCLETLRRAFNDLGIPLNKDNLLKVNLASYFLLSHFNCRYASQIDLLFCILVSKRKFCAAKKTQTCILQCEA